MNSFLNVQEFLSEKTVLLESPVIKELLKWVTQGDIISFGGGLPDPETFPIKEISEIASRGLREKGSRLLQYSSSEGQIELREQIIDFMEWRGISIPSVDSILIVNGSQQSLDMLGKILIDKGDIALMELPTYFAAIRI
jgi:DNA-binding transcriptional MocR family regulator